MSEEPERPFPGSYGIEALSRTVSAFQAHVERTLAQMRQEMKAGFHRLEEKLKHMPDQFDNLRQLISEQSQAVQQEAAQINAKLDEQTALIQQLQDAVNNGTPTPQDVIDSLRANTEAIKGFIPDSLPEPEPLVDPAPQGRRK